MLLICEVNKREILSKSAFAARNGVGASAVSNWIARGILSGDALTEDGRIVVETADLQVADRLDVSRSDGKKGATIESREPTVREQLLIMELEQRRRRLAAERGVYIRTEGVAAELAKGLQRFLGAADIWLNDVADELGLSGSALATLRTSWRTFRDREADAAFAFASTLPEALPDVV